MIKGDEELSLKNKFVFSKHEFHLKNIYWIIIFIF